MATTMAVAATMPTSDVHVKGRERVALGPTKAFAPGNGRNDSSDSSRISDDTSLEKPMVRKRQILSRKSPSGKARKDGKGDGEDGYVVDRSASPNRLKTFVRAFRRIHGLTPQEVDDFMASYKIYNLDWADEAAMAAALGPDYREQVGRSLAAYYSVINHLCSLGDVEKMYIPPLMNRTASVRDNQLLCEESIAREISLAPGMRVLDLGCGRGRVAAHMTSFSGARVTGINIDADQVAQAREYNTKMGFDNEFLVHDQNALPLPFADESFDAFYEIQALSLCRDPAALFREIHRVLRPGARFLLLDWVRLPAYDASDPSHAALMARVKPLIGAVGTPTPADLEAALRGAGFDVRLSDNPSLDGLQAGLIAKVDVYFRSVRRLLHGLVRLRALPRHFTTLFDRLCLDGAAFVEMDARRLSTTTYRIVAEKKPTIPAETKKESMNP